MGLSEAQQLNLHKLEEHIAVVAAGHPMSEIGPECEALGLGFQARGIYLLLLELDAPAFHKNLQRSVHARRYFLRKSREQGSTDDVYLALSRSEALFDAIACGMWPLAVELEQLSPAQRLPEGEYEEDYCYHRLLHTYVGGVIGNNASSEAYPWLERLEEAVDSVEDYPLDETRLEVCRAFLGDDEGGFWDGFASLGAELVDLADVPLEMRGLFESPWIEARRHLSVELLAWMGLARRRGFEPPCREYPLCPSVAWTPKNPEATPDLLCEIEQEFGL